MPIDIRRVEVLSDRSWDSVSPKILASLLVSLTEGAKGLHNRADQAEHAGMDATAIRISEARAVVSALSLAAAAIDRLLEAADPSTRAALARDLEVALDVAPDGSFLS